MGKTKIFLPVFFCGIINTIKEENLKRFSNDVFIEPICCEPIDGLLLWYNRQAKNKTKIMYLLNWRILNQFAVKIQIV